MDENSEKLVTLFHKINKKGYIKSVCNTWGSIGLTFEKEIGKVPDSTYNPDFKDIEIKCTSRFSEYPLYLFTIAFDSNENEVIRIANNYGYNDHDFPSKKVIFKKVTSIYNNNNKYIFTFDIDRNEEKVYLCVYDSLGNLLERKAYITFESLKKHITTKLNKLAYIKASTMKDGDSKYYRFYAIYLLKIKSFDTFLDLINNNTLNIEIIARVSKSGDKIGKYKCKNIVFSIFKDRIPLLFDCYYQYDYDKQY